MIANRVELIVYTSSTILFASIIIAVAILWYLDRKKRALINQ